MPALRPDELAGLTLAVLRRLLLEERAPLDAAGRAALERDPRAGAREVLAALERRRAAEQAEGRRLHAMLAHERPLWAAGFARLAGVDEAGMGTLAGPVVAAAVVLPQGLRPAGLDDSKKLDEPTRDRLAVEVKAGALAWATGQASPEEVDRLNVYQAGLLAMRRAVQALAVQPDHLLVDARRVPGLAMPQLALVKGDAKSLAIAAASVVAKTTRDALMVEEDRRWPGYGFARHKGYGAPGHLEALRRLGPCPIHRRTYAPVREVLGLAPLQPPSPRPGTPPAQGELFAAGVGPAPPRPRTD